MKKFDYKLVTATDEFRGAIKKYETANGVIAVGFSTTKAYVMEDSGGLYGYGVLQDNIKGLGVEAADTTISVTICDNNAIDVDQMRRLGISDRDAQDIYESVREFAKLENI